MRTTLNIDEDVLFAAQEIARRQKRSTGEVLSELARRALTGPGVTSADSVRSHHGFQPIPSRGGTVSNALIDRLREDEPE